MFSFLSLCLSFLSFLKGKTLQRRWKVKLMADDTKSSQTLQSAEWTRIWAKGSQTFRWRGHIAGRSAHKMTMRQHDAPIRTAKMKNGGNATWQGDCGETGSRICCWWERKMDLPHGKQLCWALIPDKGKLIHAEMCMFEHTCYMFTAWIFIIAQTQKLAKYNLKWVNPLYQRATSSFLKNKTNKN